jgi:hypothetical protein
MARQSIIFRWTLTLLMLSALMFGALGQSLTRVDAAPQPQAQLPAQNQVSVQPAPMAAPDAHNIVISEFRFLGPGGADDEFIELYNPSSPSDAPIDLTNWTIWGSNNAASTGLRFTFGAVSLPPGRHYLIVNSVADPALLALADATFPNGITADGGIALFDAGSTLVDAVGLSAGSAYKEGTPLAPLSGTSEQSYERKTLGSVASCNDTNNNAADFMWNSGASDPQNFSTAPVYCVNVFNISSSQNGTFVAGNSIFIDVQFTAPVNVTGIPALTLETGTVDRTALYVSGSGTDTLVFRYSVLAGDSSTHLDYVSANSLALNGGTITGAVGDANLILPKPGAVGSLGANNNIIIDNGIPPSTLSFKRQNPPKAVTNQTTLTFRVTFSEAMVGVGPGDFIVHNNSPLATTTAVVTTVTPVTVDTYDVTVSGGDLATFNGVVGLDFNGLPTITDAVGNQLPSTLPTTYETYTVDHIVPSVDIEQVNTQPDPANTQPIYFTVVFSEPIDLTTFAINDITQSGTASFVTWSLVDSGDHQHFVLSGVAATNGTFIPSISANRVADLAGNLNLASTSTDNSVNLIDTIPPTVTVEQYVPQADPTSALPVRFNVAFSEPINPTLFTAADITQNGTSTGVAWSITNSGDNKNFILSATASSFGTLVPSIAANRVTDMVGNSNLASTSVDNSVTYTAVPTNTPSLTPTYTPAKTVVITEVAWMGTVASSDDEWIELYNPGSVPVNLSDWQIRSFRTGYGNQIFAVIPLSGVINPGEYFLLERGRDDAVSDTPADLIYPKTITFGGTSHSTALSNSGELLLLCTPFNISADNCKPSANNLPITVGDIANIETSTNGTPAASNPWPAGSASTYGSMERKNLISNEDTNWFTHTGANPHCGRDANGNVIKGTPKCSNWAFEVTATPRATSTPTRTPTPIAQPGPVLVLNEFVPRPGHDWNNDGQVNTFDEFIEVINAGQVSVNLSNYRLDDYEQDVNGNPINNGFTLPSKTLEPGEIAVFYASQTGIFLKDSGGTVRLLKSSNSTIVDAFSYPPQKSLDTSYCRYTDGYGSWLDRCFPTPGLPNSLTGGAFPPQPNGAPSTVCLLPDNAPPAFVLAECEQGGLDIWNPAFWDALPGEGLEFLHLDLLTKFLEIFQ